MINSEFNIGQIVSIDSPVHDMNRHIGVVVYIKHNNQFKEKMYTIKFEGKPKCYKFKERELIRVIR